MWNKEYSLTAVTAPDQFKSYQDLEKRLKYVLGQNQKPARRFDEDLEDESEGRSYAAAEKVVTQATSSEDEDDALSYFQKLAES